MLFKSIKQISFAVLGILLIPSFGFTSSENPSTRKDLIDRQLDCVSQNQGNPPRGCLDRCLLS